MKASADWSQYSTPQMRCIDALWFAVPMHHTYLCRTFKVRTNTIHSLVDAGLVADRYLYEVGFARSTGMPFLTLTRAGLAVQRDWRRWCNNVAIKVTAAIPGGLSPDALEAKLRSSNT